MRKKLVNFIGVAGRLVARNSLENTLFHQRPTTLLIATFHGFSMPGNFSNMMRFPAAVTLHPPHTRTFDSLSALLLPPEFALVSSLLESLFENSTR